MSAESVALATEGNDSLSGDIACTADISTHHTGLADFVFNACVCLTLNSDGILIRGRVIVEFGVT